MNQDQDLIKAARTLVEIAGKGGDRKWRVTELQIDGDPALDGLVNVATGDAVGSNLIAEYVEESQAAAIVALHNSLHLITQLADALEVSGKALEQAVRLGMLITLSHGPGYVETRQQEGAFNSADEFPELFEFVKAYRAKEREAQKETN